MDDDPFHYIPVAVDVTALCDDLNSWGWNDYKLSVLVGGCDSYIAQVRGQHVRRLNYERVARLYNLWVDERRRRLCAQSIEPADQATDEIK